MTHTLDSTLMALSHTTRRALLARLAKDGPARVTDIAKPLDMSLNAVSKHLKVLEQAGLITRTRQGREHLIAFEPGPLQAVAQWLHPYEHFWSQQLDNLEAYFNNPGETP